MEEWISQAEYMKRYNMGFNVVKQMIANKELEVRQMTKKERFYCKVGKAVCEGIGCILFGLFWVVIFILGF